MRWSDFNRKPTLQTAFCGIGLMAALVLLSVVVQTGLKVNRLRVSVKHDQQLFDEHQRNKKRVQLLRRETIRLKSLRLDVRNFHTSRSSLPPGQYTSSGEPIFMLYDDGESFRWATNREQAAELVYMVDYYIDRTEQKIENWTELNVPTHSELKAHYSFNVDVVPNKKMWMTLGTRFDDKSAQPIPIRYWLQPEQTNDLHSPRIHDIGILPEMFMQRAYDISQRKFVLEKAIPDVDGIWLKHEFGQFEVENEDENERHYLEISILCRDKENTTKTE